MASWRCFESIFSPAETPPKTHGKCSFKWTKTVVIDAILRMKKSGRKGRNSFEGSEKKIKSSPTLLQYYVFVPTFLNRPKNLCRWFAQNQTFRRSVGEFSKDHQPVSFRHVKWLISIHLERKNASSSEEKWYRCSSHFFSLSSERFMGEFSKRFIAKRKEGDKFQ